MTTVPLPRLTRRQRQTLEMAPFCTDREHAQKAGLAPAQLCQLGGLLRKRGFLTASRIKRLGCRPCLRYRLTDLGCRMLGRPGPTPVVELHTRTLIAEAGAELTVEAETLLWLAVEAQKTSTLPTPDRVEQELERRLQKRARKSTRTPKPEPSPVAA